MKGILNINKPSNMSSSDVVVKVRRILGTKTIGHMGTLDPQGTGVLLLGVGKATKLFAYYLNKDKVYEAEFCFGFETDTLDKDGKITNATTVIPSMAQIIESAKLQVGTIMQTPPKVCAKSINGKRAYDLQRNGEEFTLAPSKVEIYSIDFISMTHENTYKFRIHCGSGTYIRSICRDLAYSLNSLATMVSINRVRCGQFTSSDAVTLDELEVLKEKALITIDEAIKNLKRIDLADDLYDSLCNGIKIPFTESEKIFSVYCKNELFGLGAVRNGILKIDTYLKD